MQKDFDPYRTLGVSPVAAKPLIREAYQKLAAKLHPDRGGDPQRFMLIRESYELLMDDVKRQAFDDGHMHLRISRERREVVFRDLVNGWIRGVDKEGEV